MKRRVKSFVKRVVHSIVNAGVQTRIGQYVSEQMLDMVRANSTLVEHNSVTLKLAAPNQLCHWRAATFSTKEPETLQWIDNMPEKSILWDIGANIGLYSIYAAKKRDCQVCAFEPAVFNLELLARNIFLNGLTDKICVMPFAVSEQLGENTFRMSCIDWGGALSTFGQTFGYDGQMLRTIFEYKTFGFSMSDMLQKIGLPQPDFIKMDVDGIEHLILRGGVEVLNKIKGILIEVNDDFQEQAEQCQALLLEAGLVLQGKEQAALISTFGEQYQHIYNQIWLRE